MSKIDTEECRREPVRNTTIKTICAMLDVACESIAEQSERTKNVMANSVSACKATAWTEDDCDHAIKNLDACLQAVTTSIEAAKKIATDAKGMQVQKSEMGGRGEA